MGEEKENLKVSEEYKKAYNQADMIYTYMPHILKGIKIPEGEKSEYAQGFKDRIRQYEMEKDAIKNFSYEQLREKYGKDLGDDKDRFKDLTKE
uniref:Uncharacterized protein n=1 Tax=Roseihalotalea indica TaxID=2867963 RepID=A0AA49GHT0_9BACT|nr:hypothetical protein K4G66_18410 [Tunicatimonas sp. TK19036]